MSMGVKTIGINLVKPADAVKSKYGWGPAQTHLFVIVKVLKINLNSLERPLYNTYEKAWNCLQKPLDQWNTLDFSLKHSWNYFQAIKSFRLQASARKRKHFKRGSCACFANINLFSRMLYFLFWSSYLIFLSH